MLQESLPLLLQDEGPCRGVSPRPGFDPRSVSTHSKEAPCRTNEGEDDDEQPEQAHRYLQAYARTGKVTEQGYLGDDPDDQSTPGGQFQPPAPAPAHDCMLREQ